MAKRAIALLIAGGLALVIVCGVLWARGKWKSSAEADLMRLGERKARVIQMVQLSPLGTQELRDQIASEFLREPTKTEECDWNTYPTWNRSTRNPNWISETKGIDGFRVICETSGHDQRDSEIDIEYDFEDSFGIVGIKWYYPPY